MDDWTMIVAMVQVQTIKNVLLVADRIKGFVIPISAMAVVRRSLLLEVTHLASPDILTSC